MNYFLLLKSCLASPTTEALHVRACISPGRLRNTSGPLREASLHINNMVAIASDVFRKKSHI